nr:hypothetical protein [Allomuricauda sp.]
MMAFIQEYEWVLAFALAWITIWLTVRHFKTSKTISYIERLNTPEMAAFRADIDAWLGMDIPDAEKCKIIEEDKDLFFKVKILTNLFTELGISYKKRIVRRSLTREIFYPLVPSYWDRLQFYIWNSRNKGEATGYFMEYLAKEVRKMEGRNQKILKKRYPYLFQEKEA